MMMSCYHRSLAAFILTICSGISAFGQNSQQAPVAASDSFKRITDPTDFCNRFELRNEYQSLQFDNSRDLLVARFDYAVSKAFALRLEVPYISFDSDSPGVSRQSGLGDLLMRTQWRAFRTPGYAVVVAAEFTFDTAQEPLLGIGRYMFQPLTFVAVDLPNYNSVLFPYVQQFWTFGGGSDVEIDTTLLRSGLLTHWPNRAYTFVEPSLFIDWLQSAHTGFTLEVEIGRFFTKNLGLYLRPGLGLWGDNIPCVYDWNFEVGLRCAFK
jgi:hypothetical protein